MIKQQVFASLSTHTTAKPYYVGDKVYPVLWLTKKNTVLAFDDIKASNDECLDENKYFKKQAINVIRIRDIQCVPLESLSFDYYMDDYTEGSVQKLINYLFREFGITATDYNINNEQVSIIWNQAIDAVDKEFSNLCIKWSINAGKSLIGYHTIYNGCNIGVWFRSKGSGFSITYRNGDTSATIHKREISEEALKKMSDTGKNNLVRHNQTISGAWEDKYGLVCQFKKVHHGTMPKRNEIFQGINIGAWLERQKQAYKAGSLSNDKIILLEKIGIVWDCNATIQAKWYQYVDLLKKYKELNGNTAVPQKYKDESTGLTLGKWVAKQRVLHSKGLLSPEREKVLEEIGLLWKV